MFICFEDYLSQETVIMKVKVTFIYVWRLFDLGNNQHGSKGHTLFYGLNLLDFVNNRYASQCHTLFYV